MTEAVGSQSDAGDDAGDDWNTVVQGHNLDILADMEQNSVDCIVTSPPYWALRDYEGAETTFPDGWEGQLGQEPNVQMFVDHLVQIFDACRRVLKPTGALWVNIDDKYSNTPTGSQPTGKNGRPSRNASKDGRDANPDREFAAPYKSRNAWS